MPGGDGVGTAVQLRRHCPSLRVVLISAHDSVDGLREALDAGCVAHLNKTSRLDDLVRAIYAAARGETTFDTATLRSMITKTKDSAATVGAVGLSRRESQILAMLAGGTATEVMAAQMQLSQHTVRNHIRNLTSKLGAHSRLEAISIAARSGLLTDGDPPEAP